MNWLPRLGLALAAVLAVFLGVAALLPGELLRPYLPQDGRVAHALGLFLIALLITASYPQSWGWVLGLGSVLGAAVELVQPVFGRGAQWADLMADIVGLVLGIGLVRLTLHLRQRDHASR